MTTPIDKKFLENPELVERLAAIEHERWSVWMRHLFSKCGISHFRNGVESLEIPAWAVEQWKRRGNDAPSMIEVDPESISSTKPVEKELAQKLYQGFYASLVYGGTGIWSDLLESQRAAWRAVASAATEHFKEKP